MTDPTPSDADREVAREIEGPCFEYDRCNDTQEYAKCGVCVRADRIAQALATARAEERERLLDLTRYEVQHKRIGPDTWKTTRFVPHEDGPWVKWADLGALLAGKDVAVEVLWKRDDKEAT